MTTSHTCTTTTTRYCNNADDILPLTVDVSSKDKDDQMKNIATKLCPFLAGDSQTLSVKPLTGGLSNELFVVTATAGCSKGEAKTTSTEQQPKQASSVLVRIHPSQNTTNSNELSIVDREVENSVCAWLSSQQIGPLYYGRFQNGRIEEFYHNHVPLSHTDMPIVSPTHIAPIMAQFHALNVPRYVLVPLGAASTHENGTYRGDIFHRVRTWITMAKKATQQQTADDSKDNNNNNNNNNEKALLLFIKLKEHWNWLEDALQKTDEQQQQQEPAQEAAQTFLREIVFTHMDMQSLNFLRPQIDTTNDAAAAAITTTTNSSTSNMKVIDFEYAGFNPRVVDIANTFCEHCNMNNLKADYEQEYPSDMVQNDFLQTYIHYTLKHAAASSEQHALLASYADDPIFLASARHEIGRYTLVSHLGWAIWSIVQSSMSDVDFDYVAYAQHRLDGFHHMKKRYFTANDN